REEMLLADAAAYRDALEHAQRALDGGTDAVAAALGRLADADPFSELTTRLRAAQAELGDLQHEVRIAAEQVVEDPDRLEAVRGPARLLRELGRKYGETLADAVAYGRGASARLAELHQHADRSGAFEAQCTEAGNAAAAAARSLSAARADASGPLSA